MKHLSRNMSYVLKDVPAIGIYDGHAFVVSLFQAFG